ncbi:hypothetical protein FOL47_008074 [Perkinsus chesapeaki]|uniref:Uncharacterized protein n=1 Tax=Perkinsus chesapeaki TaxID=330153 RepID=A0A7J6MUF9_PERCH|nr:hypothetical protein FOL47_008074 [Perkinsus chesapeaki]
MLPPTSTCISILLAIAYSQVIPEIASRPSNCLHAQVAGPYCWYILKNSRQINGGVRLISNATGVTGFASIELSTGHDSQGFPERNVAVWAEGDVVYESKLYGDIGLRIAIHIPTYSKNG